ncbi:protein kinase [Nocardia sp. NPDC046763]|uniref:protein kinase domain-containing protein n=1 Tax=Nocardia sp. NPDC046763 TaxID=3155256 RepID=UPI00340058C8
MPGSPGEERRIPRSRPIVPSRPPTPDTLDVSVWTRGAIFTAWGARDFGIAKALDGSRQLTGSRRAGWASFQYAVPERLTRPGEADRRADVYSLSCTLYHMLTGQPPYPGQNVGQIIYGHAYEPVPAPSERTPGLPRDFDELIARAMAKDPGRRFGTCTQMA